MALKGKFGHHSLKIAKKKGNTMIRIITQKRLNDLEHEIARLEKSGIWTENELNKERNWRFQAEKLNGELNHQINNLEKKVKDQREVIVNMMILLDFFSQKILKQKQTKQTRRKK